MIHVLFLCTGNSSRSQMAEAILRHHAGDRYEAHSAGTTPRPIDPMTLEVLQEKGISTEGLYSKSVDEYLGKTHFGYLVIVCDSAEKECPTAWPGIAERVVMTFKDPADFKGSDEERREVYRSTRDRIEQEVLSWIGSHDVLTAE